METQQPEHADEKPQWPSLTDVALSGLRDMDAADKAEKNERRLLSGSALGVCLAIMLAMLSLPRLDQPLHVALIALAVAAPLLILDFFFAPARPKHGPVYLLRLALWIAAWIVGDGIGIIAVVVGIGAVLWHLYVAAALVLIWSFVGSFVLLWIVALAVLAVLVWRRMRAEKLQDTEEPASSS